MDLIWKLWPETFHKPKMFQINLKEGDNARRLQRPTSLASLLLVLSNLALTIALRWTSPILLSLLLRLIYQRLTITTTTLTPHNRSATSNLKGFSWGYRLNLRNSGELTRQVKLNKLGLEKKLIDSMSQSWANRWTLITHWEPRLSYLTQLKAICQLLRASTR
jgi:hypothetical protein